ncbi:MAG: alpha/beta fold hydrolase [Gammaproteobacteria bacterium]|nr:MAG: alpha/beta fold hydrolase [Gammaproteobacteria bacterium]
MLILRRIGYGILGLLLFAALVLAGWYQIDGQPLPETEAFLAEPGFDFLAEPDGGLLFTPHEPNGHGLMIMHGALIKPQSYAKTAAYFAARGYLVYLPSGPARLSIAAVDSAAARLAELGMDDWFFIGHSMGGLASMTLLDNYPINVKAVALWAAAMPVDLSHIEVPTLFLWGDKDGLLTMGRFTAGRLHLPAQTTSIKMLAGANHRDFAMYSHQFFDNEGLLGWEQQIDLANEMTAEFFTKHF